MESGVDIGGGCACGAVRYRLEETPWDPGYCHCAICRRSSGAPVMAFATVKLGAFVVTAGTPRRRRSSGFGERWFCSDCGTQLAMRVDYQPGTLDFTIASLDDPAAAVPGFHIFFGERIPWFDCADELPRHARFRPETRGLAPDPASQIVQSARVKSLDG
jgi:hypothetical protein